MLYSLNADRYEGSQAALEPPLPGVCDLPSAVAPFLGDISGRGTATTLEFGPGGQLLDRKMPCLLQRASFPGVFSFKSRLQKPEIIEKQCKITNLV